MFGEISQAEGGVNTLLSRLSISHAQVSQRLVVLPKIRFL